MGNLLRRGRWWEFTAGPDEEGKSLESILKEKMLLSGRMLQKLTRMNGISVNGGKAHLASRIRPGDHLQVLLFPEEAYGVIPEEGPLHIIYEDEHLLVVDKPAGISVHPTEEGQRGTLANILAGYYGKKGLKAKIRHIHRLDRDTSGLLLVAKHALAHSILDEELRERRIKREYLALVSGKMKEPRGTINLPIGRDRHHATRRRVSQTGDKAVTHFEVVEAFPQGSLLRLQLETGRTHQIRVHMSHIGHPLLGDKLYGGDLSLIHRQALHAERLTFTHPFTGERVLLSSPLPEEMAEVLRKWSR